MKAHLGTHRSSLRPEPLPAMPQLPQIAAPPAQGPSLNPFGGGGAPDLAASAAGIGDSGGPRGWQVVSNCKGLDEA
jgi:hypothetical protein